MRQQLGAGYVRSQQLGAGNVRSQQLGAEIVTDSGERRAFEEHVSRQLHETGVIKNTLVARSKHGQFATNN